MVKVSAVACAALAVSGASAYSVNRSTIRTLGQKSVGGGSGRRVGASMKMEDFGLFKGTGIGFEDIWEDNAAISEVGLEKTLNKDGLRFKMNRTPEEAEEVGPLLGLPGFTVNLPLIGETYLGPPKVASIWEAIGFTATSNNEARQQEKMKAIEKARTATKGVGGGSELRQKWLDKYGYPRLVGSGGIFYADQLSTDKEPMGGFNMGKSGVIWPVPDVVKNGTYGGGKGWGMKKSGPTVDGLKKADKI
eukprot:CAMPEP_0197449758 /NCGR_PEP_ID=MMETSP1175-20131217/22831_1 /TAXON_ID=1003142 /ORGANISM="Triceratium dubium, Strain CCMP147" /LENGTH=247 /DNA_ID=CAMNT_0042981983 /DNA_START=17 /DNA_END=760 /DNA_ORIENTATION=-